MAGKGPILSDDLEDEREGARTYGKEARQARKAGDRGTARKLTGIQRDEKRHARVLKRITSRKGR